MAAERLVIDASAAVLASVSNGWPALREHEVLAPSLLWSEGASALRQLQYRREITAAEAASSLERLLAAPIVVIDSRELLAEALELASQLGWAKTYDAEFVILARRLNVPLLTIDRRLATTARRVVSIFPA